MKALAEDLMNGNQEVSSLSESDYQSAIQGLSAVRHQAMLGNNRARQKRADNLISEITMLRNRPKPKPQPQARWTPRTIKLRKPQPSPTAQGPVTMTDSERKAMNEIVDHLLQGHEIDTIEADAIPKLYHILKIRKVMAIDDGSYNDAKIIDKNMTVLVKMQSQLIAEQGQTAEKVVVEQKVLGVAQDIDEAIKRAQRRMGRLQNDLEREEAEINEMRAKCEANIFATLEDMANELESEKRELEMGFAFRPSKRLLEMREEEARLARHSFFDEAAVARRRADQKEILERKEFDRKNRTAIERKEKKFNEESEAKIRCSNEFFAQKIEKLRLAARKDINTIKREIQSLKERFKRVTGRDYDEVHEEMEALALRDAEEKAQRQRELQQQREQEQKPPKEEEIEYREEDLEHVEEDHFDHPEEEEQQHHEEEEKHHEEEAKHQEEEEKPQHHEEEEKAVGHEGIVVTEVIDCNDVEEEDKQEKPQMVEAEMPGPDDPEFFGAVSASVSGEGLGDLAAKSDEPSEKSGSAASDKKSTSSHSSNKESTSSKKWNRKKKLQKRRRRQARIPRKRKLKIPRKRKPRIPRKRKPRRHRVEVTPTKQQKPRKPPSRQQKRQRSQQATLKTQPLRTQQPPKKQRVPTAQMRTVINCLSKENIYK